MPFVFCIWWWSLQNPKYLGGESRYIRSSKCVAVLLQQEIQSEPKEGALIYAAGLQNLHYRFTKELETRFPTVKGPMERRPKVLTKKAYKELNPCHLNHLTKVILSISFLLGYFISWSFFFFLNFKKQCV